MTAIAQPRKRLSDRVHMATQKTPTDSSGMGKRLQQLMTDRGMNQQQLENAIGASRGYLSRIISGSRGQKISPEYLTSLSSVLRCTPNFLRWGIEIDEDAIMTPAAGLSRRLEEIPGYREAEFEVIRKHPEIPFAIFEAARSSRMGAAPESISPDYLGGLVRFLASSHAAIDQTDAVKSTLDKTDRTKSVRR